MASRARKQQLNGFHEPHWTLSQTVAWILLREPGMVDRAARENVDELALIGRYVDRELANDKEGATTEPVTLPTGTVVNRVVSCDIDAGNALKEAMIVLHRKLAEGKLVATGARHTVEGNDPPAEIPAGQWAYLDFEIELSRARPGRSVPGENRRESYHVPRWDGVRFMSRDVRTIWREGAKDQEPPTREQARKGGTKRQPDTDLQIAIDEMVLDLHEQRRRATLSEARKFFVGKGAHSFDGHGPEGWSPLESECDDLYIDGRPQKWKLCYQDRAAYRREITDRGLERYLAKAKDKLPSRTGN